jgi:dihydroorotate dehydrogenase
MGFPGKGIDVFEANFRHFRNRHPSRIAGANIGINKDTKDPAAAYAFGYARLAKLADYIAVNISSPNTQGLRELQTRAHLDAILSRLCEQREVYRTPLLIKIAPDLDDAARLQIAEAALSHRVDGLIVSNTTTARPEAMAQQLRSETGGLSGALLMNRSTEVLRDIYRHTKGAIPLIGVGGVSCAADAYAKIRAGAALVQVYTALVYQGPKLVEDILQGLVPLLLRDGFSTIKDAVGADVKV